MIWRRLQAERITSHTLVGVGRITKYPISGGNCFSVKTEDGEYRIVNFGLENIEEAVRRGVSWPMTVLVIGEKVAVLHDERIPNSWYQDRWCEVCCPENRLPVPQQLEHLREEGQGVRTYHEWFTQMDFSKRPKL